MARGVLGCCLAFMLLVSAHQYVRADDVQDDEYADSDKAHLIVYKSIPKKDDTLAYPLVVQGRNVTVTVTIHNAGSGNAGDVVYTDELPAGSKLLDGALSVTFPKIASGSTVKHTYSVVFTSGGSMDATFLPPGTVTYKADADTEQTGKSTKAGIFVLTPVQQITRYALIAGAYASLGICRTPTEWRNMAIFLGVVGTLLGANLGMKHFSSKNTTTRRKKALQELEKDE